MSNGEGVTEAIQCQLAVDFPRNSPPVWIIDEAQNLSADFFRDFPSFMNFAFDSPDLMTVWLAEHRVLERKRFALLIAQALKGLPCQARPILCIAMKSARPKGMNHLPDEILQQAISELQRRANQNRPALKKKVCVAHPE